MDDVGAHDNASFKGAGWKNTAINIKIPIHKHAEIPGVHNYLTTIYIINRLCLSFRKSLQTKHMMNCSLSAL
jgi:hypothetical protein